MGDCKIEMWEDSVIDQREGMPGSRPVATVFAISVIGGAKLERNY